MKNQIKIQSKNHLGDKRIHTPCQIGLKIVQNLAIWNLLLFESKEFYVSFFSETNKHACQNNEETSVSTC